MLTKTVGDDLSADEELKMNAGKAKDSHSTNQDSTRRRPKRLGTQVASEKIRSLIEDNVSDWTFHEHLFHLIVSIHLYWTTNNDHPWSTGEDIGNHLTLSLIIQLFIESHV